MASKNRSLNKSEKFSPARQNKALRQGRWGTKGKIKHRFRRNVSKGGAVRGAQNQLKRFKQGSILAVALTGFLLLLLTPGEAGYSEDSPIQKETNAAEPANGNQQKNVPDSVAIIEKVAVQDLLTPEDSVTEELQPEDIGTAAKDEAFETLQNLWEGFYMNLPKILVALFTLFIAWLLVRFFRFILRKTIGRWESSGAVITLVGLSTWFLAIGIAISVVAGDIRALVGSLGLVGLALSWSLQTPIESFTGWLLNSFRRYYKVGDRINVGDVFGDVYKIDFLTTTVWEIGAPYRQGFVQAEQPTGRLVTFPNNEILSGSVVNLTGDFPYVWDELAIAVANESDIQEAIHVIEKVALDFLGDYMRSPAQQYHQILKKAQLNYQISEKPQVFVAIGESWTDVIIRYLVGARERRKWKSELSVQIIKQLNKPEYIGKIKPAYSRQQLQLINPAGMPIDPPNPGKFEK